MIEFGDCARRPRVTHGAAVMPRARSRRNERRVRREGVMRGFCIGSRLRRQAGGFLTVFLIDNHPSEFCSSEEEDFRGENKERWLSAAVVCSPPSCPAAKSRR